MTYDEAVAKWMSFNRTYKGLLMEILTDPDDLVFSFKFRTITINEFLDESNLTDEEKTMFKLEFG